MIRVSVLYRAIEGARFDHHYWSTKHMPLVLETLTPELIRAECDRCLDRDDVAGAPPFLAVAHLFFESLPAFEAATSTKGGPATADVPNYTDIAPQILVSETHEVA